MEDQQKPQLSAAKRRKPPRYRDNRNNGPKKRTLQVLKRPERDVHEDHMQQDSLKVTHLGGLGEIGRNMQVLEYREDIMLIDAGFGFPEDDQPGIDYNLPNVSYLECK